MNLLLGMKLCLDSCIPLDFLGVKYLKYTAMVQVLINVFVFRFSVQYPMNPETL